MLQKSLDTYTGAPDSFPPINKWDWLQYRLLRWIAPGEQVSESCAFEGRSKLRTQLGEARYRELLACTTVIDFGCGGGEHTIELAQAGVRRVIGLEIRDHLIQQAREAAARAGVADRCVFASGTSEQCDAVVSMDSFEHFHDPAAILQIMHGLLRPDGRVYVSFGYTWYHPLGGHLFSVFPWAHLVFSETALCAWRRHIRNDGATRFHEVEGGLNKMTIGGFERLVVRSPLRLESLECIPIRKLGFLHTRLTREFTSALVRATLYRP